MIFLERISIAICYLIVCSALSVALAIALIGTLTGVVVWP